MKDLITSRPAADELAKLAEYTDQAISLIQQHAISLDDSERKGLRTMGTNRSGIVRTMSNIALSFEECLPRSTNARDLESLLDYHVEMSALYFKVGKLFEMVRDTVSAIGADAIQTYDDYNNHFQTARKKNSNLDIALQPIDDYNKRFGKLGEETVDPDEETDDKKKPDEPKA
ncbi:MAG: hypothetical protein JNM88_00100 [Chitinophagaceae bacterium]|nr:hypothetical protein [Chitinophagaceae bacterium]